ncbi:TPA: hypothetical protein ACTUT5_002939 [Legionella anisa]|uniref:hypothetical protein n=1 Tax=Legionella anisa TaxID=28082 RepID=UPI000FD6FD34|nr:hypothetical protein [Legionella anisa]MBN5935314.1 hypothetical protein [Legionella anisa]MCW8426413.1 hypothetical protein [Legionella anisa]MCW8448081.1 hypothetical protein [Legionella anisa]UAK78706.1 hypothetical protein K8O89_13700 [Legionella anisa]
MSSSSSSREFKRRSLATVTWKYLASPHSRQAMFYFTQFSSNSVISAYAGIHFYIGTVRKHGWIPAFAGMTTSVP